MRWWVMVAVLGACDGTGAAPDSGPGNDSGSGSNSNLPPCGVGVPFDAAGAYDVVSDGTDLFVSVRASDGTMQVITMPIGGGNATTIAAGTDTFDLAASGAAVFYQLRVDNNWELHQRVAGVDTIMGAVPAFGPIELEANATDLYVLGPDKRDKTTLWRLPRAGFSGATPTVVSVAGSVSGLALGTSVATLGGALRVSIPGPSTATPVETNGFSCCSFVGDSGYGFGAAMMTQNTIWAFVDQLVPTRSMLWRAAYYKMPLPSGVITDDKHVYLVEDRGLTLIPDNTYVSNSCPGFISYDATHLFGLWSGAQWFVTVVAKPL
jgi:hypothetical protein